MSKDQAYLIWSFLVLALSYSVPYFLLEDCKSLILYAFWLVLTVTHFVVSLVYLKGREL